MLFYVTCLPVCYSCYLTRSLRRRRHDVLREVLAPTLESGVEKALFQTVSATKCRQVAGDAGSKPANEIEVNVIILHSATSQILQKHLYGDAVDSTDGHSNPQQSVPLLRRSASTQPNLEVVLEDGDVDDVGVQLRRGVTLHPSSARPSVTRRWSQIGAFGSTVARLSRRKKQSAPGKVVEEKESEDVVDGDKFEDALSTVNGCEEKAILRKPKR